ncbi:MAG TPA: hypothetical protein PKD53_08910, partial [Chloroflexaceae bacterium]|nr:hypothetical protein [Chloroflexaceae bacterium]
MNTVEPFPLNTRVIYLDFRDRVFTEALHYARAHRAEPLAQQLERVVNSRPLPLNGFSRTPFQAVMSPRLPDLAELLSHRSADDHKLFDAVLRLWVEAHGDLADVVRAVCAEQGVALADKLCTLVHEERWWGPVEGLRKAVLRRRPELDEDAASLMIAALTGLVDQYDEDEDEEEAAAAPATTDHDEVGPAAAEQGASATASPAPGLPALAPAQWPALMALLRDVPAESELWELSAVEEFRAALGLLAEEKQVERSVRRAGETLARLRSEVAGPLDELELDGIFGWSVEPSSLAELGVVQDQLDVLRTLLVQWDVAGTAPRRPRERDPWLVGQRKLEDAIATTYQQLGARLHGARPPRPLTDDPGSPSPSDPSPEADPPGPAVNTECATDRPAGDEELRAACPGPPAAVDQTAGAEVEPCTVWESGVEAELGEVDRWHGLLWSLLADDEIAGASWLAQALNRRQLKPPCEEQLWCAGEPGEADEHMARWRYHMLMGVAAGDTALLKMMAPCEGRRAELLDCLERYGALRGWTAAALRDAAGECGAALDGRPSVGQVRPGPEERALWAMGALVWTAEHGLELHPAALLLLNLHHELDHRLWRAQVSLLLPLLDRVRRYLCLRLTAHYGAEWPWRFGEPLEEPERELVRRDPMHCGLGHLSWLLHPQPQLRAHG